MPSSFDQPARFAAGVNIGAGQRYVYGRGFERVRADFNGIASIGGFEGVTLTAARPMMASAGCGAKLRATHDEFERAIRFTAGEFTPSSTSFQGSARSWGLASSGLSDDPPLPEHAPDRATAIHARRESSVDVLVNQVRVQTVRLAAGRYDIGDFPFAAGPNQVQLVVEDIGGKREILDFDVFNSTSLLTPACPNSAARSGCANMVPCATVASPAATGYGYFGLSDNLTLGANAQATTRRAQIGGVAVLGTPIGFFQIETAASRSFAAGGIETAASLDYRGEFTTPVEERSSSRPVRRLSQRRISRMRSAAMAGNSRRWMSPRRCNGWPPMRSASAAVSAIARRATAVRTPIGSTLTLGRSFGRLGLSATGSRLVFGNGFGNDTRVALGLSLRFGRRDNLFARYDSGTGRSEVEVSRTPDGRLGEIAAISAIRRMTMPGRFPVGWPISTTGSTSCSTIIGSSGGGLTDRPPMPPTGTPEPSFGFADGRFGVGRAADEGFVIAACIRRCGARRRHPGGRSGRGAQRLAGAGAGAGGAGLWRRPLRGEGRSAADRI